MKANHLLFSLALLLGLAPGAPAQHVPVVEKTLSNGMRLLLVERHDDPSVAGGWVAHVGSANEHPGITGIAHLFEHMMFKGTPTVGTKDYRKDLEIIDEQEKVRDEMRQEMVKMRAMYRRGEIDDILKPESRTEHYKELEAKFNELIAKQRDVLVKNEFDKIYTSNGGSGMNAFTTPDMTAYFITVPANKLELWMWMESSRLLEPVFREFYAERDVVFEERRMRTEATPLGRLEESFESLFWESHPYGWPTVGWPSDIPSISKVQADEFYGIYYAPQNVTAILVGDFNAEQAAAMAEKYFGRIPHGKTEAPDVVTLEIRQAGEKRLNGEGDTNPQIDIMWHTPAFEHKDTYPLAVLAQILNGRTGRLYKGLVLGAQIGTDVSAAEDPRKWAGVFDISGEVKEGHTPEELENGVYAELEKLKTTEVPAEELQKVKNNFAAGEYRKLSGNMAILYQLIHFDGEGDWHAINDAAPKYQAVTAADLKRVANLYFTKDNRCVGTYTRKAAKAGGGGDTELAELPAEVKPVAQQMMAQVKGQTDAGKLKQMLGKMEERLGQADATEKALIEFLKKKVTERIAELEKK